MMPTAPQNDAGWRMEPPVSEPREIGVQPPATAAAEPPLDPSRDPLGVGRVPDREERGVLVGRAHGELVAVRLADDHGPGFLDAL